MEGSKMGGGGAPRDILGTPLPGQRENLSRAGANRLEFIFGQRISKGSLSFSADDGLAGPGGAFRDGAVHGFYENIESRNGQFGSQTFRGKVRP